MKKLLTIIFATLMLISCQEDPVEPNHGEWVVKIESNTYWTCLNMNTGEEISSSYSKSINIGFEDQSCVYIEKEGQYGYVKATLAGKTKSMSKDTTEIYLCTQDY